MGKLNGNMWPREAVRLGLFAMTPPSCYLCGEENLTSVGLCSTCWERCIPLGGFCCSRCSEPLEGHGLCSSCSTSPPAFDASFALWIYTRNVRPLLLRYKYGGAWYLGRWFAALLSAKLRPLDRNVDIIVPVPLSPLRRFRRGYNQAEEIAKHLSKQLRIPWTGMRRHVLVQKRPSSYRARFSALQRVFSVRQNSLSGKTILLVDDVMTTGATLHFCAKTLKEQGGANSVLSVVLARASKNAT